MTDTRALDQIDIGLRHRKDFGDIAELARSIDSVGLLQPIVVTAGNVLIAGERRLRAWQLTKYRNEPIPVHTVDLDQIVRGEHAENSNRKPFTLSEIVAITRSMEPLVATPVGRPSAEMSASCANKPKGKTVDKVAAFAGVSPRQIEKAKAVVEAAEANPDQYGGLLDAMDRTGRANGPYKRLRVIKQTAAIRQEAPGLPNRGPYRCIVADMPWPSEPSDEQPADRGRAYFPYPTMSIKQMCEMGPAIRAIAHEHTWLWFWTTNFHLLTGCVLEVLKAWDFTPVTMRTWAKNKMGQGQTLRGQTEHVILAKRGSPVINLTNQTTLLYDEVLEHSEKPGRFYADVETLCPSARYAELFSRRTLPENWDGHGDQVGLLPDQTPMQPSVPPTRIERTQRNPDGSYNIIFSEVHQPCCKAFRTVKLSNGTTSLVELSTPPKPEPIIDIPAFLLRPTVNVASPREPELADAERSG